MDNALTDKMKSQIREEYPACKEALQIQDSIPDINTWTVEFIRCGACIIEWSQKDLANLDEMNIITMTNIMIMNRLRTS